MLTNFVRPLRLVVGPRSDFRFHSNFTVGPFRGGLGGGTPSRISKSSVKSVQSALSDLKRPPDHLQSQCNIILSLLDSILMARFLKQSFAQSCLKEMDNGKLQQFNYSRSLITNRGTVERGIGRIAKNYYAPLGRET